MIQRWMKFGVCVVALTCGAIANAERSDHFAQFDDIKVHYESIGEGNDAIVFVHGWTCAANSWQAQRDAFSKHRLIFLDLPGHGQSDKPKVDYTIPFFARAVEAVMRDAKIERAVLVGHSMGTPIIREFYRQFPQKVRALVIVDGALRSMMPKERSDQFLQQLTTDYPTMADGMLKPMRDEDIRAQIRATMLATPDYVAISGMRAMADESVYRPDRIDVPVLAVLAKSPFWAADTETFLRSLASQLEFHMLDGVSHFLMLDKPEEFNALLRGFLATLPPA